MQSLRCAMRIIFFLGAGCWVILSCSFAYELLSSCKMKQPLTASYCRLLALTNKQGLVKVQSIVGEQREVDDLRMLASLLRL